MIHTEHQHRNPNGRKSGYLVNLTFTTKQSQARPSYIVATLVALLFLCPLAFGQTNAGGFAGADCGAKIMAADASLLGVPNEILIDQTCGTSISTAVAPTAGHSLKFIQPGRYTLSGSGSFTFTMPGGSLSCVPNVTILNSANNAMVTVNGAGSSIHGCTIDGGGLVATLSVDSVAPAAGTGVVLVKANPGGSGYKVGDVVTVSGGSGTATLSVSSTSGSISGATVIGGVYTVTPGTNEGTGYAIGDLVNITGGIGTGAQVQVTLVNPVTGALLGAVVTGTPGSGYTIQNNIATTAATGSGINAQLNVTALLGQITGFTVTTNGSSYATATAVSVSGGSGSGAKVDIQTVGGGMRGASVGYGGTGYSIGDTLTLSGGTGTGGKVLVTSVSSGLITGVSLFAPGTGYAIENSPVATTGGHGSGATVNITGIGAEVFSYSALNTGVQNVSVGSGGSGYSIGDLLTLVSPTGVGGSVQVTSVSGGAITGLSVKSQGRNYALASGITTQAVTGIGSAATVNITGLQNGITTVGVAGGGSGYSVNDILSITGGGGSGASAQVTSVSAGVITGLTISNTGASYSAGSGLATSGGSGSGATVNITATGYAPVPSPGQRFDLYAPTSENTLNAAYVIIGATNSGSTGSISVSSTSGYSASYANTTPPGPTYAWTAWNGYGVSTNYADGFLMEGTTIQNQDRNILLDQGSSNYRIVNNKFVDNVGSVTRNGGGTNILFQGNTISPSLSGTAAGIGGALFVFSQTGKSPTNLGIWNNTITAGKEFGITVQASPGNIFTGYVISGNVITAIPNVASKSPSLAEGAISAVSGENATISNNTYTNLTGNFVENSGFELGVIDSTISGNALTGAGMSVYGGHNKIVGNHIKALQSPIGLNLQTNVAATDSSNNLIENNEITTGASVWKWQPKQGINGAYTFLDGTTNCSSGPCFQLYTLTGTTATVQPTWNPSIGGATTDGTATTKNIGLAPNANFVGIRVYCNTQGSMCNGDTISNNSFIDDGTSGHIAIQLLSSSSDTIDRTYITSNHFVNFSTCYSGLTGVPGVTNSNVWWNDEATCGPLGTLPSGSGYLGTAGLPLVGAGVPLIIASADLTNLTANISNYTIYSVPAAPAFNHYRVCEYGIIRTAAATSSVLPTVSAKITDPVNSVAVAVPMGASSNVNTTSQGQAGCVEVNPKPGTSIYLNSSGYASNPATSMAYDVHATVEALR